MSHKFHCRTIEHTIDENSPLLGETHKSLVAMSAEIVVSVSGVVDSTGLMFAARQSYLPNEIKWYCHYTSLLHGSVVSTCSSMLGRWIFFWCLLCRGHTFQRSIHRARDVQSRHTVELARFHQIMPLHACSRLQISNELLSRAMQMPTEGAVPSPSAHENPIVISDCAVMCMVQGLYRYIVRYVDCISSDIILLLIV